MINMILCPVCKSTHTSQASFTRHGCCGYCARGLPSDSVLKPKQRSVKKEGK